MTLAEIFNNSIDILKNEKIEAPVVEAGVILCFVLGRDKTFLYAHPEYILTSEEETRYIELIKERSLGTPVQYLTGRQEFMSLDFRVNSSVLIPRHDTEILVETAINHAMKLNGRNIKVLDIGTGSGCIAISIAYYIDSSMVTAIDISEEALAIARGNAIKNGVAHKLEFVQSDIFSSLKGSTKVFDIIVSNPPYIPSKEIEELQVEVRNYEPLGALDGGVDGLDFYRRIVGEAANYLAENGLLALEVGYNQAGDVARLMEKDYYDINIIRDLAQIGRVVSGKLKPNIY